MVYSLEDSGSYRIVRRPVHNAYGPLGVAVSERCAYGWQWIDGLERAELGRGALRGPLAVSLRVLHCRRQPTAAEELLADLARIRLGPVAGTVAGVRRPRLAVQKPKAADSAGIAAPAVPANPSPAAPTVAVNGSRTLVMLPQRPATPQGFSRCAGVRLRQRLHPRPARGLRRRGRDGPGRAYCRRAALRRLDRGHRLGSHCRGAARPTRDLALLDPSAPQVATARGFFAFRRDQADDGGGTSALSGPGSAVCRHYWRPAKSNGSASPCPSDCRSMRPAPIIVPTKPTATRTMRSARIMAD